MTISFSNLKPVANAGGNQAAFVVVNDGLVDSDPDMVTISVTSRQDQVVQTIRQAVDLRVG